MGVRMKMVLIRRKHGKKHRGVFWNEKSKIHYISRSGRNIDFLLLSDCICTTFLPGCCFSGNR